jgi:hypothetical protein
MFSFAIEIILSYLLGIGVGITVGFAVSQREKRKLYPVPSENQRA